MKLGNKAKQAKAFSEVINLIRINPMSAKQIAEARGTKSSHNLLKAMDMLGLVRKHEVIRNDHYHIVLWIAVNKQPINIKAKSVFEMNILAMAS